jgi:DNA-binding transcriptional ArsR family regulator
MLDFNLDHAARGFAALGDATRLTLFLRLGQGEGSTITDLSAGLPVTRQAVTKHLTVLHEAGLIDWQKQGRAARLRARPESVTEMQTWLDQIGREWQGTLERLKAHVEAGLPPTKDQG